MPPLSQDQIGQYLVNGYLQVSGLIPDEVVSRAEDAAWRCMGVDRNDPATWDDRPKGHPAYEDADLVACYTPALLAAAAQLGEGAPDPSAYGAPRSGYCIHTFPTQEEWRVGGPHIDHSIKEHGHKTFPHAFRLASMTFLSDVDAHGGGTLVWPGSHMKTMALARSDPKKYEYMWVLGREMRDLVDVGDPVETTPRAGDVVFYHFLCSHSGSMNTTDSPRIAMNRKW